jgi:hypothetical protein
MALLLAARGAVIYAGVEGFVPESGADRKGVHAIRAKVAGDEWSNEFQVHRQGDGDVLPWSTRRAQRTALGTLDYYTPDIDPHRVLFRDDANRLWSAISLAGVVRVWQSPAGHSEPPGFAERVFHRVLRVEEPSKIDDSKHQQEE